MHGLHAIHSIQVEVSVDEALNALHTCRHAHQAIVAEAREGYLKAATKALRERTKEIAAGKVVPLQFYLPVPVDHTKHYDTVIKMLESHKKPTITLDAAQVECILMDKWDWQHVFTTTNAPYSAIAASRNG